MKRTLDALIDAVMTARLDAGAGGAVEVRRLGRRLGELVYLAREITDGEIPDDHVNRAAGEAGRALGDLLDVTEWTKRPGGVYALTRQRALDPRELPTPELHERIGRLRAAVEALVEQTDARQRRRTAARAANERRAGRAAEKRAEWRARAMAVWAKAPGLSVQSVAARIAAEHESPETIRKAIAENRPKK
jgi:hypothetical protein